MALNDMLAQYRKCYECGRIEICPDFETKIRVACLRPSIPLSKLWRPKPIKSKYFDDRRFDSPKKLTLEDIICELERRNTHGYF